MKNTVSYLGFLMILTIIMSSCKKDPVEPEPLPSVSVTIKFQDHVLPIFNAHCNGGYCHGGGADSKYYDTHANVIAVPGATIVGAINHNAGFEPMPKSQPKLRQGEIDTITTWISEGRMNN